MLATQTQQEVDYTSPFSRCRRCGHKFSSHVVWSKSHPCKIENCDCYAFLDSRFADIYDVFKDEPEQVQPASDNTKENDVIQQATWSVLMNGDLSPKEIERQLKQAGFKVVEKNAPCPVPGEVEQGSVVIDWKNDRRAYWMDGKVYQRTDGEK